uniref:Uncharacterized protein n=1 Tax=Anopheles culicifacies TaxID=139723 RepID=A0A182LXQ6_9DIPT
MQWIFRIESDSLRQTLRAGPERLPGRAHLIGREVEQQLTDLIRVLLLEIPSNVSRAHCKVCSIAFGKFFKVQIGIDFSGGSCEELYDSVKNGGQVGIHYILKRTCSYLNVAESTERSRFQQWLAVVHTATIHVDTCINIVQGVCNTIQPVKERIIVEALRLRSDTVLMRRHLYVTVHTLHCLGGNARFRLLYVTWSEQELTIQVALFDQIHIGHNDFSITLGCYTDHGKVLQQLTTDCTRTDDEVLQLTQHILELAAKHGYLPIIT